MIISGSDKGWGTEVRSLVGVRLSDVRTFIRLTPFTAIEKYTPSPMYVTFKHCIALVPTLIHSGVFVKRRSENIRISSVAGEIICKSDYLTLPPANWTTQTSMCALLFANPRRRWCPVSSLYPHGLLRKWIKLWWLDLREVTLIVENH